MWRCLLGTADWAVGQSFPQFVYWKSPVTKTPHPFPFHTRIHKLMAVTTSQGATCSMWRLINAITHWWRRTKTSLGLCFFSGIEPLTFCSLRQLPCCTAAPSHPHREVFGDLDFLSPFIRKFNWFKVPSWVFAAHIHSSLSSLSLSLSASLRVFWPRAAWAWRIWDCLHLIKAWKCAPR